MAATQDVLVERLDDVAVLTINRPDRRNGIDVAVCWAMLDAVRAVSQSDARVLVVRGAGRNFCVGADLQGSPQPVSAPGFGELEPIYQSALLLHTMPQVTIAAIDGGCAGAGLGWACACDLRFASSDARFATAFLNVGVSGDMGLPWTLTQMLGTARARELLLLPEKFDAARAFSIGLISEVLDADVLHETVLATAQRLAARNPLALRLMKANLVSAAKMDFVSYMDIESARHMHTAGNLKVPSPIDGSARETRP